MSIQRIFLDTEFTGLTQDTELISLGLYLDEEHYFYAEFNDWNRDKSFKWLEENVVAKMEFNHTQTYLDKQGSKWNIKNNTSEIAKELTLWFSEYPFVEIWSDVMAYDWVLFCQIFGGAFYIPQNIFYTPFDLATYFRIKNVMIPISKYEGDLSRYEFSGQDPTKQHHALEDARAEFYCYQKLSQYES